MMYTKRNLIRLFDGNDIAVDYIPGLGSKVVVTFTSFEKTGGATVGAWSGTIGRLELPGIFFISKWNHWFNSPELPSAIAAAMKLRANYETALLSGASMGAHAALRLANRLDASVVVAVSPQMCIRQAIASFDTRFIAYSENISEYDTSINGADQKCSAYVFYDGNDIPDRMHVDLIEKTIKIQRINLIDSGHSSIRAIADLKLLDSIFDFNGDAANDGEVARRILQTYEAQSVRSAAVICAKAKRISPRDRRYFLSEIPSNVVGIRASMAELDRLKEAHQ